MIPYYEEIMIFMWREGDADTLDIAETLNLPESEVYNFLARHREEQREVAA